MATRDLNKDKQTLESFSHDYGAYLRSIGGYNKGSSELRVSLQKATPLIAKIVDAVHDRGSYPIDGEQYDFHEIVAFTLLEDSNKLDRWNGLSKHVKRILNEAIGNIENNTIPLKTITPVLPIRDAELKTQCSDLLNAPGSFDRVIREATVVLEDRLRKSVSRERLAASLPMYADHTLEKLINVLLVPEKPIVSVSTQKNERVAFHRMMLGVSAYLRNPFHHALNKRTEWALAWSVVGLVDSLLFDLGEAEILDLPEKDNKKPSK